MSSSSSSNTSAAAAAAQRAAAYKALLDYYANTSSAASHIVSLTLGTINDTLSGNNSSSSHSNSSSFSYEEDALAASNYNVITESIAATDVAATVASTSTSSATEMPVWLIPSYSVILLCAVLGNLLVISTLVQNRRMRTITNLFLLNLAISDMLLGVLCMPVTLVGTLLRNFIFGEFLCKLIQFAQAASVAVSSWTLVAISCERYYAICHPLRSRSWQTISHAYKIIGFIWLGGILCMTPIAVFSQLIPTSRPGYCKCRDIWPDQGYERMYNILLDLILLVLPLLVLCFAYILITRTLYVGMGVGKDAARVALPVQIQVPPAATTAMAATATATATPGGGSSSSCVLVLNVTTEYNAESSNNNNGATNATAATATATTTTTSSSTTTTTTTATTTTTTTVALAKLPASSPSLRLHDAALRRSNEAKTLESKKRVVKMLFVLVLEFFICWTPLYVINTLSMFIGQALYEYIDYTTISFLQLLAYSSSCCNPITYCFMNASFRRAFVDTFKGLPWHRRNAAAGTLSTASQAGACAVGGVIGGGGLSTAGGITNAHAPGLALGMDTWRTRSRHEQLLNSVVYTNSAAATESPQL